jgi:hypothetical protein
VADFNGDGKPDLAVGCIAFESASISVLLGNGDGTFQPSVSYYPGSSPNSLVASDFNGDGNMDLVVAAGSGISVFLGKGDGTFNPSPFIFASGGSPVFAASGDFNVDGKPDLAVANSNPSNAITILLNRTP